MLIPIHERQVVEAGLLDPEGQTSRPAEQLD
jgi:hypothetical protein